MSAIFSELVPDESITGQFVEGLEVQIKYFDPKVFYVGDKPQVCIQLRTSRSQHIDGDGIINEYKAIKEHAFATLGAESLTILKTPKSPIPINLFSNLGLIQDHYGNYSIINSACFEEEF